MGDQKSILTILSFKVVFTLLVFLLAIFGMICWGIAPVFGKLGLLKTDPLAGLALRTYLSTALLTFWMVFSGKLYQIREIPIKSWLYIGIEGILATLVGDFAYYAALKYGDVSFVTLVMASSPLVSMLMSVIILNEQITLTKFIGAIFILAGLLLIVK
jgi:Predicted membrane protein